MRTAVSTAAFFFHSKLLVEKADDNSNKLFFFCIFKYGASVAWALRGGWLGGWLFLNNFTEFVFN